MPPMEDFEMPVAKRQRIEDLDGRKVSAQRTSSRLFAPYRTLGLVSPTETPFTSIALGKTTFQITTSVGKSLQTYDLRRGLNLVFLTRPQTPETITATVAHKDRIYAAWGGDKSGGVWVFQRGKYVGELDARAVTPQKIEKLIVFGTWIVACGAQALEVWKSDTYEHYTTIQSSGVPTGVGSFCGQICTLPTYLNKVLVGGNDGNIEVYNISTGRLVHTILTPSADAGSITALQQCPTLSIVAAAYADGSVIIHDLEADEPIMRLRTGHQQHPITSISFRTDGLGAGSDGRQEGVMATASTHSGDVTLWDLNNGGKVVGVLRSAHDMSGSNQVSGITKVEFLQDQAVLVSSGLDNALKSWVFDHTPFSAIPRPLHARSGHGAPVNSLKFLPAASDGSEAAGKWLLSAGQDRSLWTFSLRKDGQSSELSQGNVKSKAKKTGQLSDQSTSIEDLKAPSIISMACSLNRDAGMGGPGGPVWANQKASSAEELQMTGWESVVTAHEGDKFARTWFWGRKKAGRWALEASDHSPVTTVAITTCGTFALIGSTGGSIDMFNLQSGIHRQRFPPRLKNAEIKKLKQQALNDETTVSKPSGHRQEITGLVVDNLNQNLVSTSLDGSIIFWDFSTGRQVHKLRLTSSTATAMRYNAVSGLVALACDDLAIRVLDMETKKFVRELWGSAGQVYDHCFSHDGRWIVTSSMDSVVRVFDLATGHLIDAFRTATCTSLAFSSTGEFLATAHAGQLGINIWNNKALYTQVATRQIDEESGIIDLTSSATFNENTQLVTEADLEIEQGVDNTMALTNGDSASSTIEQLDKNLLTLSLLPVKRWQTLLNLESIRARNKPIEPPKKPQAAPFFLGSALTAGQSQTQTQDHVERQPVSSTLNGDSSTDPQEQSRISRALRTSQQSTSAFSALLAASAPNTSAITSHIAALSPSSADLEIRTLTSTEHVPFIRALTARLREHRDFELVNAWMSVWLKIHGDPLGGEGKVCKVLKEWRDAVDGEEARLGELVGYVRGVGEWLRSGR